MSEAILTSHLTISYLPTPAASGSTAPAGAAAASSGTPAGDGTPAGFLAALIDQLLAGAATAPTNGQVTANADTTTTLPAPFGTAIDPTAAATVQSSTQGRTLLAQLTRQLQALRDEIDKGKTPDPDQLKKLGQTVDAIAALIAAPTQPTATAPTPAIEPDPLAGIGDVASAPSKGAAPSAPTLPAQPAPATPSSSADQIAQYIASLGGNIAAPGGDADSGTPAAPASNNDATPPLPGIAKLAEMLSTVSQTIAPATPGLAQKLANLSQTLTTAETTPQVLAQLTTSEDVTATVLDKTVQSLLTRTAPATAMATPPAQTASTSAGVMATLAAPAPPTPPVVDPPQAQTVASSAQTSAPATKVASTSKADPPRSDDDGPKPEARVVAAVTARTETKDSAPDNSQQPSQVATAATTPPQVAAPRVLPAAYQSAVNPINMGQVAFEMIRQMNQGTSRFSIRLDPPELGRVDVKMHVDAAGTVNARLTVEKSETLDMFQRDRGSLEKALSQAGLDGAKTNLEFSLRQNPFAGMAGSDQRPSGGSGSSPRFSLAADDDSEAAAAVPAVTLYRGVASAGGVNLFV